MNILRFFRTSMLRVLLVLAAFFGFEKSIVLGQGTAFTYQGRLNDGAGPANGTYDLRFAIYDSTNNPGVLIAGPITNAATTVSNGLFTVTLDFGSAFSGSDRFLEVGVRTNSIGAFTTLNPRQKLSSAPYAIFAANAGLAAGFNGTLSGDVNGTQSATVVASVGSYAAAAVASGASAANAATSAATPGLIVKRDGSGNFSAGTISAAFAGNGAGLTNLSVPAANLTGTISGNQIGAGAISTAQLNTSGSGPVAGQVLSYSGTGLGWSNNAALGDWALTGNGGTGSTNFLGTIDNQPLELRVNGSRALRLEPNANGAPNVIAGSVSNSVGSGAVSSTIGGGSNNVILANSYASTISGGQNDSIQTNSVDATISGGEQNAIGASADGAAIGGGIVNVIGDGAGSSTIAGGFGNTISNGASFATIGGGQFNVASNNFSTIAGGQQNGAYDYGTVGGGFRNVASGIGGTVGGGQNNRAAGLNTTAGGGNANFANGSEATIAGGRYNIANSDQASIGGGFMNQATNPYATVPGGNSDVAGGSYSFAAGNRALALHTGAFVWADSTGADFASTTNDQFLIRANGGVGIGKNNPATALDVSGTVTATSFSGSGSGLSGVAPASGSANYIQNQTASDQSAGFRINGNGIFNGGNVGIGTPNPQGSVHVYSTNNPTIVRIQSTGTPGFGRLEFASNPQGDPNEWRPGFIQSTDNGSFTGGIAFYVNGTGISNRFATNEVMRIVNGNVGIGTTNPTNKLQVVTAYCTGTSWVNNSDRNLKQNFAAIDAAQVLDKIAALPIGSWSYRSAPAEKHIGPMAQDFHAAFGLGDSDRAISTVDEGGVALAAIQGLNEKVEDGSQRTEDRVRKLEAENADLKARVEKLEQLMRAKKEDPR